MIPKGYLSMPYDTPKKYQGKHKGKSILIIGTGHSTKRLVKYKHQLKKHFDVILGLNFSTYDFESELDYHMILEKNPVKSYKSMKPGTYRKDLPRILNWKSLNKFPKDILAIKATRSNFDGEVNIRKYNHKGSEGFLIGPAGIKGLSVGSVSLNAIHFAGILGCNIIYMMGADLLFRDKFDHYYPDNLYRKSETKKANRSPIIKVSHRGKQYVTTKFFQESAVYINSVIVNECKRAGIEVFDFSDGLITAATKLNIEEFMK